MIGYTLVGTNDLERAKTFYDALFKPIGATRMMDFGKSVVWGVGQDKPGFGVTLPYDQQEATPGNGTMIGLVQDRRANVDALYAAAMAQGGMDEGAPGLRGDEGPHAFYAAYFRDLDGNKLCAYAVGPADA
ncbi:VOC family protein [Sphingomonas sp. MMS24-J13]|uniref:VOC family protein n=1 Tax=Sphingomonas sp. MMS24-J13 TaxID=3238686 RepID=UPI00384DEB3E